LNLNVWTPAADSKKRPVAFVIFGGGHMEGSNSELGREGYNFAPAVSAKRDLVVVAPNYRVGPFGYLYLAHLLGERYAASGSLGLLDQILALKWVRDNIARFGGDPDNVTIIGQSAGAKSVCNLLLAPSAKGLFHKAVAMSGAFQSVTDVATDIALTKNYLNALGLEETQSSKLLDLPSGALAQAVNTANEVYFKAESYGPTADGTALPSDIDTCLKNGQVTSVPAILGHTKEELFFPVGDNSPDPGDDAVYRKFVWKFGNNASHVMDKYRALRSTVGYAEAYGRIATDYTYVQAYTQAAGILSAMESPVYLYRWDYTSGHRANHSSDNEAWHSATHPDKYKNDPEGAASVDRMFQELVVNFIKTGVPAAERVPEWKPYSAQNKSRLFINAACALEAFDAENYDPEFPRQVFKL
jgi:para-nitrobenzyl esterase